MAPTVRRRRACRGDVWTATVQPPLPYRVTFDLLLTEVDRRVSSRSTSPATSKGPRASRSRAAGRLRAALHLRAHAHQLDPAAVARVASPIARYGHEWVLNTGLEQFRSRAL